MRYIGVLVALGLLAFGNYLLIGVVTSSHKMDAREINLAGRQRMLSQRIMLLSSQLDNIKDEKRKSAALKELGQAIDLMRRSHLALTRGDAALGLSPPVSEKIKALYFGPAGFVDAEVREFLALAQDDLENHLQGESKKDWHAYGSFNTGKLLQNLDTVANHYQMVSDAKDAKINTYHTLTFIVMLLLLGGSGILVLRPIVARIQAYMSDLAEVEKRFRSVFKTSLNAMVTTDQAGNIIAWNPAAERTFGYNRAEILNRPLIDIIPERYRAAHEEGFQRAVNSGGYCTISRVIELHGMKKNGEKFPIELSLGSWIQDGKKYFNAVIHDTTERKRAEAALRKAKEEAEKASRAKSDFLASMSHELRTPLNAILGFAQMLQFDSRNPLSPMQKEYVDSILNGGNRLLDLVNNILDLTKIEAEQIDLSLEEVSANEIVAECVALEAPFGETRGIKIIDHFSSGPAVPLRTDRLRLKQILFNLLSNAVKFNKDGGTVTVEGRETGDGFFRLSVTDTGIGIAEKDHSEVFQMFHCLGADPMRARDGTGIGLTVAKHLVERMAGRIGLESEEGDGSTFWIELPLVSNKEMLIWTDALRIGVDAIDRDHQVLVALLNRVRHEGRSDADLDEVIRELIDYTHYHFRREETVMEVCGYPELEKHRAHHRDLADQVMDLIEMWRESTDPERHGHLYRFLQDWLFEHIMKVDAKISQYTKGKSHDIRKALESFA
jgi:hemerythrin-like metal-binding protein/PAS domain S-box-containing protein